MKKCSKCKVEKSITEFSKNKDCRGGIRNSCRACNNEHNRQYRQTHKKEIAITTALYRQLNKEKIVEYARAHKENRADYHLQRNHGLSMGQVREMFSSQRGKCLVCEKQMNMEGRNSGRAHVDHNHQTGKNRGLICDNCNRGLGFFHDNIRSLKNAIIYLGKMGMA